MKSEQEAEHKELEQLTCESDVAEETMSVTVKLARDPLEPSDIRQPTAECQLMTPSERRVVTRCELRPVQGREEDTEQRVMTLHTEMCEKSEVTSVEEGHDVERMTAQSDVTAGILKQLNGEMSAGLTAFKKKGLDRKTNHRGLTKAETKEVAQRPPPWRDKHATIDSGRKSKRRCDRGESMLWLAASYWEAQGYKPRRSENFRPLYAYCTQYHKHFANDTDELERYGLFKKLKARVSKHDDQSKEHHHEGANLYQSCRSARCHKRESQW